MYLIPVKLKVKNYLHGVFPLSMAIPGFDLRGRALFQGGGGG